MGQYLPVIALGAVVATIGCGEIEVPKASIPAQTSTATAPELLGTWIALGGFESHADDVASQMQNGIVEETCRLEFKDGNRFEVTTQGSDLPVQTGQWQVVSRDDHGLSIQIVASDSTELRDYSVVFRDQNHLIMTEQSGDDGLPLEIEYTRLRP